MRIKKLLLALAAFCAAPAFAQVIGTVQSVNGVATITTGTTGLAIAPGATISHGSRVITTSSGSVTLRLNNGCVVTVPPGHGVTVLSTQTCEQLRAAIQPVTTTVNTLTTTTTVPVGTVGFTRTGGIAAAVLLGAAALAIANDDDDEQPLSPR